MGEFYADIPRVVCVMFEDRCPHDSTIPKSKCPACWRETIEEVRLVAYHEGHDAARAHDDKIPRNKGDTQ